MKKAAFTQPLIAIAVLLSLLGAVVVVQGSNAQESQLTGNTQLLRELLSEIRLLRKSVQDAQSNTYIGLLVFERIRLQQEHVDRLTRQLNELKREQMNLNAQLQPMQERFKVFESQLENERDPGRRSQLESEFAAFKNLLEQETFRQRQQQELEPQLTSQLQSEQAKLNELNQRLLIIEKVLAN